MVEMIGGSIVDEMEKDNLFEKEMKEHYVYALTTMIEKWITTIFILAMGVLAKQIVPMILFLIFFWLSSGGISGFFNRKRNVCLWRRE